MAKGDIKAIKALAATRASGDALARGRAYRVPADLSERDAEILIRMGKAEAIDSAEVKKVNAEADKTAKAAAEQESSDQDEASGD